MYSKLIVLFCEQTFVIVVLNSYPRGYGANSSEFLKLFSGIPLYEHMISVICLIV